MQQEVSRSAKCLYLGSLILCFAVAASGRGSRNFGGDYRILHVGEDGDNVQIKMSLRLINNSGADMKDVMIALTSSLPTLLHAETPEWEKEQPPLNVPILHYNEHKIAAPLEGTFTIPRSEYELWQRGSGPTFVILYRNTAGKLLQERVELAPAP